MAEIVYERPAYRYYPSGVITRIVNTVIGVIEFLLALRIVLKLLNASSSSQFVAWVYNITDAFVRPFAGAFASWNLNGTPLDITALFAMVGYAIIGWLILWVLGFLFSSIRSTVV